MLSLIVTVIKQTIVSNDQASYVTLLTSHGEALIAHTFHFRLKLLPCGV
jgi:hypothetical protein